MSGIVIVMLIYHHHKPIDLVYTPSIGLVYVLSLRNLLLTRFSWLGLQITLLFSWYSPVIFERGTRWR
jgi:hypothetical protein